MRERARFRLNSLTPSLERSLPSQSQSQDNAGCGGRCSVNGWMHMMRSPTIHARNAFQNAVKHDDTVLLLVTMEETTNLEQDARKQKQFEAH